MGNLAENQRAAADTLTDGDRNANSPAKRWVWLVLLAALVAAAFGLRHQIPIRQIAEQQEQLRELCEQRPVASFCVAFVVYVAVTALSLPGAAVLSLVTAWFLGFWPGTIVLSLASTIGATLAMLISRHLLRRYVEQRFGERLTRISSAFEHDGAVYLLTLRLIPLFPFFVVNLAMGLTRIRVATYCWVSWLGMLPGTCLFAFAGSRFPDVQTIVDQGPAGILTWDLILAFSLLGLFPLVARSAVARLRRHVPRE